eukprot:CAMPEP_0174238980 /NCGR_PEP_ID=MMETSP0417-20130205/13143_1 /TAXON_ID=242541 /ORGANISM="Mayorella sp, Strain BSH-02190019" /LENGTH=510 /DNA_ID=CAMNT_0015317875 /DNA_START=81 /DNA_END=1611 /DNA_ORIENTATION=-
MRTSGGHRGVCVPHRGWSLFSTRTDGDSLREASSNTNRTPIGALDAVTHTQADRRHPEGSLLGLEQFQGQVDPRLLERVRELGYKHPTLPQQLVFPSLLPSYSSSLLAAPTGTGKTLAYLIPLLNYLVNEERAEMEAKLAEGLSADLASVAPARPRALILVPSRELTLQVGEVTRSLTRGLLRTTVVAGGGGTAGRRLRARAQASPVDVAVCTPDTASIFYRSRLCALVVDEVDAILAGSRRRPNGPEPTASGAPRRSTLSENHSENGHDDDDALLQERSNRSSRKAHTNRSLSFGGLEGTLPHLCASALARRPTTFIGMVCASITPEVQKMYDVIPNIRPFIAKDIHQPPQYLNESFVHVPTNGKLAHVISALQDHAIVPSAKKSNHPASLLESKTSPCALLFCNTIASVRAWGHILAEKGYRVGCLHSQMPPKLRAEQWQQMQAQQLDVFVCSDLLSRGMDTTFVPLVINVDFPRTEVDYLHRVGRTARAGARGSVVSLVTKGDRPLA